MSEQMKVCRKCAKSFIGKRCKECRMEYLRIWTQANKDKVKKANEKWRVLPMNKEKINAAQRIWKAANRDRINEVRRASYALNSSKWYAAIKDVANKANREATARLDGRYIRAKLRMSGVQISPELIEMKRQQLQFYRAAKQLKALLNQVSKGEKP
jgi:hypothetical protein